MKQRNLVVQVQDVTVRYGHIVALNGASLAVPEGAFVALIGPNGAGKTTLLRVILGLVKPEQGTVRVFGQPPEQLGRLRSRIGYVPQGQQVDWRFPVRVRDVVLMGRYGRLGLFRRPSREDWAAVERALEEVGIPNLMHRPLSDLSGGQRQRVFLARALVNQPDLLLLDEPTAGVDTAASESLYVLLQRLHRQGMTVVLVSHDVGVVAQYVDSVACINRKVVVHGRPEVVLTENNLAEAYGCDVLFFHHGHVPHMVVRRPEEPSP